MAQISSSFSRDANGVPITTKGLLAINTRTYTGASGLGAAGTTALFTVTGDVIVNVFATCSADLSVTGAATIEIGITGNTAAIIAQTTASGIDVGEIWVDNATATVEALPSEKILTGGTDINEKITTADLDGGSLTFYCIWIPLSSDGNVVSA